MKAGTIGSNKKLEIPKLLQPVAHSYDWSIKKHGPIHRAAAWKNAELQFRRFQIFLGLIAFDTERNNLTINDFGCGYGAMFDVIENLPQFVSGKYFGYDISKEMLQAAENRINDQRASFILNHKASRIADYSFVSGTYNMKMAVNDVEWQNYIEESIIHLWSKTNIGMGFNMLNAASPQREKTLYYADPNYYLEFCKQNLTCKVHMVDLLHPYEFVIFLRR